MFLEAEDFSDVLVAWRHFDAEGDWRAAREAVVLGEVDRLVGELLHVERPEEVGDCEEDLLLSERDARADAPAAMVSVSVIVK